VAWNCDPLLDAADCGGLLLQTHPPAFPLQLSWKQKEASLCFLQKYKFLKAITQKQNICSDFRVANYANIDFRAAWNTVRFIKISRILTHNQ